MRWHARTAEDTEAFGGRLARTRLQAGNPPAADQQVGDPLAVVYLTGDLGAGKTTLARGFLRACGIKGPVRSPTYTLLEAYEAGALTVLHLDLYRLQEPLELENLGLREWALPGHVWLIEWPDRGAGRLPPADVSVTLSSGAHGHALDTAAHTPLGESWLARLAAVEKPTPQP